MSSFMPPATSEYGGITLDSVIGVHIYAQNGDVRAIVPHLDDLDLHGALRTHAPLTDLLAAFSTANASLHNCSVENWISTGRVI